MTELIHFQNISKKFKNIMALENVDFSIKQGRCVGLLGVNGAGKTTTLRILSGLLYETSGDVIYKGRSINHSNDSLLQYKKNIGYLPQHPKYFDWMTGYEYLAYVSDLYQIPPAEKKERIEQVLETVRLKGDERRKIGEYSGGMKQRLGIAQAILNEPEFLILDEPVSALDPEGRYQIINLIDQLKRKSTVLLSTHILHDADGICDDVIILHNGKKIIDTELAQLKSKYIEPVITISLVDPTNANGVATQLKQYHWIEDIKVDNKALSIKVNNKEIALEKLPIILLENNSPFTSFQITEPKLEDIFLRLVSEQ